MEIPVLIAARNEAASLGATLDALPQDCRPIVIPNGCTDNTEQIAASYGESLGVQVVSCDQEGKMPALQAGLRSLGRTALETPFITLDAHNRPLFPRRWVPAMMRGRGQLDTTSPAVTVGMGLFVDGPSLAADAMHTVGQLRRQYKSRFDAYGGYFPGFNMLVDTAGDPDVLEGILALPNLWPGEDEAIKDVVVEHGGNTAKVLSPLAMVTFPARRHPGVIERLLSGARKSGQGVMASYAADAPSNSLPYQR